VTDNIFDRLAELLQSDGPVNWRLAAQIAESVAGPADPIEPWIAEEYEELGRTAAMLIGRSTVLDPAGLPPLIVTDPRRWAVDAVESFAYLAEPMAEQLTGGDATGAPPGLEQVFGQLAPALVGLQVGGLVGAFARALLGQFDAGLPPVSGDPAPAVIVPNVEAFADAAGLDVRQARLWAALRETASRAQLSAPWAGAHLGSLVAEYLGGLEIRPDQLEERLQSLQDPAELERMMAEPGGIGGFAPGPELDAVREDLTAMLAFLDGHGRATVAEVAGDLLPDLEAIEDAAAHHLPDDGSERLIESMFGIEIDAALGPAAASFCTEVERRWGGEARERLWSGPETLPTSTELRDPVGWAARVLLSEDG
jgi:putative hydrolase